MRCRPPARPWTAPTGSGWHPCSGAISCGGLPTCCGITPSISRQIETRDNGKLIREMLGQTKALAGYYHYYAGLADKIVGETIPLENTSVFNYTLREPVGVVAIITPWNSPLLILSFSLAAGWQPATPLS